MASVATRLPTYFISHGAPNMILQKTDSTTIFLRDLGRNIRQKYGSQVKAILMISAHWEAKEFTVNTG